jgi:hypothetical protein
MINPSVMGCADAQTGFDQLIEIENRDARHERLRHRQAQRSH